MRLNVREFLTEAGESPYRRWLEGLDLSVRARIQARVLRFESGNLGDHKAVGRGVWEARFPFGPGYRLYFAKHGGSILLLLLGGAKTTERADIARAQRYWAEYLEDTRHGTT